MKKFLSLIAVVFLLIQLTSLASDVNIQVVASRDTAINRAGNNLCFDLFVLNPNNDVNEIKFLVTCTINDSIIHALPIPGYLIKSDGTQDPTKWSDTLDAVAINSTHFRYWMGSNPANFLGKSSNLRMIGTFYIIVGGGIPQHGQFKIQLSQISVTGVDDNNNRIVNLSAPSAVSTTLDLGGNAPGDTNALQLSTLPPTVNRPIHQARVRIAYNSPAVSVRKITFDVLPEDLVPIDIILDNPTGKVHNISEKIGNHYELSIESSPNQTFPTSTVPTLLAEIVLNFDPTASGDRTIVMTNFQAWDASYQPITVTRTLSQVIHLGEAPPPPPPTRDTLLLNATGSINRLNEEVRIDLSYSGSGWDTISFDSNLPAGFRLNENYDPKLTGLDVWVDGSRITISANNQTITTPPGAWFQIFTLVFSYDKNITGSRTLVWNNIIAKKGDITLVVPTQPLVVNLDFGTPPPPPDTTKLAVYYGLFPDNNWFDLRRDEGRGTISLLWYMDNIVETTGGINFDLDLPYYMNLQQVIPLNIDGSQNAGQDVGIQEIANNGSIRTYRVVYSAKNIGSPLLPNPQSNNPRPIMKLVIGFTDLPAGILTIPVNNIVASGLDGRIINQTKAMNISIDFLNWIYLPRFIKGDVNTQFGDGQLTQTDVKRMIQLMLTRIYTLYEFWASDMNGDGKVDVYDLTILQNLVGWTDVVEAGNSTNEITVAGRLISFNFPDDSRIDFGVYDYIGRQIKHSSYSNPQGQVDLSELPGGMYFIRINKKTKPVLF